MADWNGLFQTDGFKLYQREQSRVVATVIRNMVRRTAMGDAACVDEMRGMLRMAQLILKLPERLTGDAAIEADLAKQLELNIADMTRYLVRTAVLEDE